MLNMKNIDRKVVATVAVFLLLAVVYFIPKPVLRMALPEIMVKYRMRLTQKGWSLFFI